MPRLIANIRSGDQSANYAFVSGVLISEFEQRISFVQGLACHSGVPIACATAIGDQAAKSMRWWRKFGRDPAYSAGS